MLFLWQRHPVRRVAVDDIQLHDVLKALMDIRVVFPHRGRPNANTLLDFDRKVFGYDGV